MLQEHQLPGEQNSKVAKKQTTKVMVKHTKKDAHPQFHNTKGMDYNMSVRAKQLDLATIAIHVFSCSRKGLTYRLADIRKKTALALAT